MSSSPATLDGTSPAATATLDAPPATRSTVVVAGHPIGPDTFTVIAGPCSVLETEQTVRVAIAVRQAGATMLRGGAFKPRSDPDAFQGHGARGIEMLREAKARTGLAVVTECLDVRDLEVVLSVADMIQVGARSMHNTGLLKALGEVDVPILIKRGMSATIDETIKAAGYVRRAGNDRIVLCERGIRTFETGYRFTLDLTAVPILQARSGAPVLVDPSHAPGRRDLVLALSKAAAALGADGLIVEADENPHLALSDPAQQLRIEELTAYVAEVHRVAAGEGRRLLHAGDVLR